MMINDELISKTDMLKIIDDERFTVDRKFERLRGLKGQSGEWINLNEAKEHFKYISSLDKEQILHILDRLPTATADNWIPCSERLPERTDKYLVTVENGNVYAGTFSTFDNRFTCKAVAWMELPEAYRDNND